MIRGTRKESRVNLGARRMLLLEGDSLRGRGDQLLAIAKLRLRRLLDLHRVGSGRQLGARRYALWERRDWSQPHRVGRVGSRRDALIFHSARLSQLRSRGNPPILQVLRLNH